MSHPLTDSTIRYVEKLGCHDFGTWIYTENDLRRSADWQLDQVVEWLRNNLNERYIDDRGDCLPLAPGIYLEEVIDDLKKAMRPTGEQQ